MLYLVMVTYNDMPHIQQTIRSVTHEVDEIIAIDGRYADFPQINGSDFSTDGTVEFLESAGATVIGEAGLSEIHKRNCYLVGSIGDWYLHLDADEEWLGDVYVNGGVDMMLTPLKRNYPAYDIARIRLFRHIPGLHYEKKHYWLHDEAGQTVALLGECGSNYKAGRFKETKILHHEHERSDTRQRAKDEYYDILRARENPIQEVN